MRIITEFRPRDGGSDIYMRTDEADPAWMMLRWEEARNRLTGYSGTPSKGGISKVRPITFTGQEVALNTVGTAANWCFLQAHGLRAHVPGEQETASLGQKVAAWEAFLGTSAPKAGGKGKTSASGVDEETAEMSREAIDWLLQQGRIQKRGGDYVPMRTDLMQLGLAISGFEAFRIQGAVSKVFPPVAPPKGLDLDHAKAALIAVARPSSHAVQWYASPTGDTARDRLQAAKIAPVLAELLAENPAIARAVDARSELQALLLERTGLSKAGLKRLSKVTQSLPAARLFEEGQAVRGEDALGVNRQRRFSVTGTASLDVVLRHLAALPPDRVPQDNAEWLRFHDVVAGVATPIENAFNIPVARTLAAAKGDWASLHAILAKAADFSVERFDLRAMALTTIDAIEAVEDFARSVILPQALASIRETGEEIPPVSAEFMQTAFTAATRIFTGETKNVAAHLLETARRYASRIPALMDATGFESAEFGLDPANRWAVYGTEGFPQLTRSFPASNGLVVRPLPDFAAMRLESDRLKHCVGRLYLSKARSANCHIFSVQNAEGSISHSTIELSGLRGDNLAECLAQITLIQHRALHNQEPSEAARLAYQEFFQAVKSGQLPINRDEVMGWKEHIRTSGQEATAHQAPSVSWKSVLGMDWENAERRSRTWEEWRFILGGAYGRAETPEVVYRTPEARGIVGAMSPRAAAILIERAAQARREEVLEP